MDRFKALLEATIAALHVVGMGVNRIGKQYTSFRCIKYDVAEAVSKFDSPFPFVDGYLSWITSNCTTIAIEHGARLEGRSTYTFRKLVGHTLNIFATFSDLPLRFASWVGLVAFIVGMIWFVVIIIGKLAGMITVTGFASLMGGIILSGGIQLLILGVIGEYLGRMNFRLSRKPLYLVAGETAANIHPERDEPARLHGIPEPRNRSQS